MIIWKQSKLKCVILAVFLTLLMFLVTTYVALKRNERIRHLKLRVNPQFKYMTFMYQHRIYRSESNQTKDGTKLLLNRYSALCKESFTRSTSRTEEIWDSFFGCEISETLLLCLPLVMALKTMKDHSDVVVSTCHHDGRKSNFSLPTLN